MAIAPRYDGRMRKTRDLQQTDLFDPWAFLGEKRRRLLEGSWAGVFRDHLLEQLPIGKFAEPISSGMGRPTKDLHVACGVLILQQLHDLTDAGTVEALAFNIAWHYALDIRDEGDAYLCEKTLRNYRRLVIDHELDQLLFAELTDQLIKAFNVVTDKQRLDSTAICSAMRSLTRLGVVVESISKFVRELSRVHPQLYQDVDRELIRRHVERTGEGCFADTKPSESKRRLPEAGEDLLRLFLQFEKTEAAELESFVILDRVLHEQFEVVRDDSPNDSNDDDEAAAPTLLIKEPKDIPCDNVRNPADPDSSYNKHRGQGYMVQIMETFAQDDGDDAPAPCPDLITHVAMNKMTVHDGHRLAPAIEDVRQRQVQPQQLLADTHYGSNQNMREMTEQGITLVSPAMSAKGSQQGQLTLEQFELDDQGLIIRCPAGHEPTSTGRGKEKLQARFDAATCRSCPLLSQCLVRTGLETDDSQCNESVRFQYTHERVAMRQRRLKDQTPQFKKVYRWRAGIEATMSRLKHQMHLVALRVRGWKAVGCRVMLRALGLNIHRCAAFLGR